MSDVDKPGVVKVVFDYPFQIGVPNEVYIPVTIPYKDGTASAMLRVYKHEGSIVFDKNTQLRKIGKEPKYKVILKEINPKRLAEKIKGIKHTALERKGQPALCGYGENDTLLFYHRPTDLGLSAFPWFYTRVEVFFQVEDLRTVLSRNENQEDYTDVVGSFFNKFLDMYRDTTGDVKNLYVNKENDPTLYWTLFTAELSKHENLPYPLQLLPDAIEKLEFKPFYSKMGQGSVVKASYVAPYYFNAASKDISDNDVLRLMKVSASPSDLAMFNQVLLSGIEQVTMHSNYRVALVQFDTAVDVVVRFYLFSFLKKKGLSNDDATKLLDGEKPVSNTTEDERDYQSTKRRMKKLEAFIKESNSSFDLFNSTEYKTWDSDCRKIRNEAIHAWKDIGKKEAEMGLNAAQALVRMIQKECS